LKQIQFLGASVLCILGEIGGIITLNIIQIQVSYTFPSLSIICTNFLVSGTSNFPLFFPKFHIQQQSSSTDGRRGGARMAGTQPRHKEYDSA
jgi:hypothetical protein